MPNIGAPLLRLFPGCFVLQDVPMLSEYAVGDADDVGSDPTSWPSMARKAPVDDHKFLVSEDHAVFVSQRWRRTFDQIEGTSRPGAM